MNHSSAELKQMARNNLSDKWRIAIGITVLQYLILMALSMCIAPFQSSTTFSGTIVYLVVTLIISLITGVFNAGGSYFFLNICRGREYSIKNIFAAFKMNPDRFIIVSLFTTGVSLLVQVPSIILPFINPNIDIYHTIIITYINSIIASIISMILSLFFNLAHFLLLDFPEIGALDSMKLSAALMRGNKWRYFYIFALSFFGWNILGVLSFGIGYLWITPYIHMTTTYFYCDVLEQLKPEQNLGYTSVFAELQPEDKGNFMPEDEATLKPENEDTLEPEDEVTLEPESEPTLEPENEPSKQTE